VSRERPVLERLVAAARAAGAVVFARAAVERRPDAPRVRVPWGWGMGRVTVGVGEARPRSSSVTPIA